MGLAQAQTIQVRYPIDMGGHDPNFVFIPNPLQPDLRLTVHLKFIDRSYRNRLRAKPSSVTSFL